MDSRKISDRSVSAIGLGCMPLSRVGRDGSLPDRSRAIATVRAALDAGVDFFDTADCYAPDDDAPERGGLGHNELLLAEALGDSIRDVLVATKGGIQRDGADWPVNGRPAWIREAVEGSLSRLGVDSIGLYQHHRPDPDVPYAESIGTFRELYDEGKVMRVGVSNADPDQIREADNILGEAFVSVQNQFSPAFRSSEPELELCGEIGLAFLPWSPFGGMRHAADLGSEFAVYAEVGAKHGVSPQQVCLAWMLALAPQVVPIPGASRPESIQDCVRAVDLELDDEDRAALGLPVVEAEGATQA